LDIADQHEEANKNEIQEDIPLTPSGDQLADQWLQIQNRSIPTYEWGPEVLQRASVFVTAHHSIPFEAFEDTFNALSKKGIDTNTAREQCFWLNWQSLHGILSTRFAKSGPQPKSGTLLMIKHLYELLERKRLRNFRGFDKSVERPEIDHRFGQGPVFWNDRFFSFLSDALIEKPGDFFFWREKDV
jgi:hypothetical protein